MFKMRGNQLICLEGNKVLFKYDVSTCEFIFTDENGEHRIHREFNEDVTPEQFVNELKETFSRLNK